MLYVSVEPGERSFQGNIIHYFMTLSEGLVRLTQELASLEIYSLLWRMALYELLNIQLESVKMVLDCC